MELLKPVPPVAGETAIVIGAGISGLCAARELLLAGFRVTVLEAGSLGEGCSYGNAGMVVPSHFTPLASPGMLKLGLRMMLRRGAPLSFRPGVRAESWRWVQKFLSAANRQRVEAAEPVLRDLSFASRVLYQELALAHPELGFQGDGLLMLCQKPATLEEETHFAERARELGLRAEILNGDTLRKVEPNAGELAGAVHFLDDAHLNPGAMMRFLRDDVQRLGGQILEFQAVTSIQESGEKVTAIHTASRSYQADRVVLAAGALTGQVARKVGLQLPMLAGRGYSFVLRQPAVTLGPCAILTEARVAVSPLGSQLRLSGGMRVGPPVPGVDALRLQNIAEGAGRYYPGLAGLAAPAQGGWWGWRPLSPDGIPYLGRVPHLDNLVIAAGHGMMGFSLGPITGRLVARMAAEPTFTVSKLLCPTRYSP